MVLADKSIYLSNRCLNKNQFASYPIYITESKWTDMILGKWLIIFLVMQRCCLRDLSFSQRYTWILKYSRMLDPGDEATRFVQTSGNITKLCGLFSQNIWLFSPKFHYRVHNSQPLVFILDQISLDYRLPHSYFKVNFHIIFLPMQGYS